MADKDISSIPQGFITGIPGGILNECLVRKIKGLALLAKANKTEPDSGAAATLIEALLFMISTSFFIFKKFTCG